METESLPHLERADLLPDQRALVERARRGDPSAHRALYEAHVDRIFRLTFRLIGREDAARELTQDTFVRAFASISGFRGDAAFSTWLHTIAVSVTLNEIKRSKRQRTREAPLEEALMVTRSAPESDPVMRERLAAAVADLPEGCRTVFMMHDAEGYTHEEIATALGVTPGTSKAQLFRARGKLRIALADFAEEWKP
ncbi:MAG: polymerase sigma factor, sigma-70 family [Gemmatimonadetes bacterium]|nr:polymerase sigma factor, sigma-70 family [Gemmatimonadota bacterium]